MQDLKPTETPLQTSRSYYNKETIGSILIVFFASLLAIVELINNNLAEQMLISHNQQVNYANWYQAKSIKQNLKESEMDHLNTLLDNNLVPKNKSQNIKNRIAHVKSEAQRYEAEKTEILIGSAYIPREHWAQDLNGTMGAIVGVNEWILLTQTYAHATRKLDLAKLFFQICMVLCAVCIVIRNNERIQRNFIIFTLFFGVLGIAVSAYGFMMVP